MTDQTVDRCIVVVGSGDIWSFVASVVGDYAKTKPEFVSLDIIRVEPTADAKTKARKTMSVAELAGNHTVVAVVAEAGVFPGVAAELKNRPTPPPLVVVVGEALRAQDLAAFYETRYLRTVGVFPHSSLSDPDERGNLAIAIKQAVRLGCGADRIQQKPIAWKIATTDDDYAHRRFVSLLLDERMRDFVQQLNFTIDRHPKSLGKPPQSPDLLVETFQKIGDAMKADARSRASALTVQRRNLERYFEAPGTMAPAILLEGETGTGKTVIARWISRCLCGNVQFFHVPLVNVSAKLLEAELFGTIAGAFTDAVSRPGSLLLAYGRVVFLDEIGDAPLEIQAKLLAYLDTFGFRPDAWPYPENIYSPVFVVAATNMDLRKAVREGTFREDLYYRFRHRFQVPALRDRQKDLRVLISFVLQDPQVNRGADGRHDVTHIDVPAIEKLQRYAFPGNFRELEDVLTQAVFNAVRAGRTAILADDIQFNHGRP